MEQTSSHFRCLSGSSLKIIAIIAMAIDHFAASIVWYGIVEPSAQYQEGLVSFGEEGWLYAYTIMRYIGRIAFPIFCFLLVVGFLHSSNRLKYALRLFTFALISEIPFDLAIFQTPVTWDYQNVFFTLLIGFLVIWAMDALNRFSFALPAQAAVLALGCVLAYALKTDYDYKGILVIAILYFFRYNHSLQTIAGCLSLLWEAPACLAFIPINMYNGKRGVSLKYFFYLFYPIHLLIFGIILQFISK